MSAIEKWITPIADGLFAVAHNLEWPPERIAARARERALGISPAAGLSAAPSWPMSLLASFLSIIGYLLIWPIAVLRALIGR